MAKLNDSLIKATPQDDKECILADGESLYLRVRPTGKAWFFRYKLFGKPAKVKFGSQHREMVVDDRFDFVACPITPAHSVFI